MDNSIFIMKRGIIILLFLFLLVPLAMAEPPSFHVFRNNITCENNVSLNGKVLTVNIVNSTNISDFAQKTVEVSNNAFVIVISSTTGHNVNFLAGTDLIKSYVYVVNSLTSENIRLNNSYSYCVIPTCTDGIQNGNETGVDCGGSCNACSINNNNNGGGGGGGSSGGGNNNNITTGGSSGSWVLSDDIVDLDQQPSSEVITAGGEYQVIIGGKVYILEVTEINAYSVKIVYNELVYYIPKETSQDITLDNTEVKISYLENQNEKVRLNFTKGGSRYTLVDYPVQEVLYFLGILVALGVAMFFFVRWINTKVEKV